MILELGHDIGSSDVLGIPNFSNNMTDLLMTIQPLHFLSHFLLHLGERMKHFSKIRKKTSQKSQCFESFFFFFSGLAGILVP